MTGPTGPVGDQEAGPRADFRRSPLLPSIDDNRQLASATAAHMHALGAEGEVMVTSTHHALTRFANSFIHQHIDDVSTSVVLNLAVDGRSASATTSAIDTGHLDATIRRTLEAARRQPVDERWPGPTPAGTALPETADAYDPATAETPAAERADQVARFIEAGGELNAAGYLDVETTVAAIASTAGFDVAGASTRASLDGIHRTDNSAGSAHQTARRFGDLDGSVAGNAAAAVAQRGRNPVEVDPGDWPVILLPEAVASIVVFLSAYGFNAKAHAEGASFVQLGSQQFDEAIDLWEDPFDPLAIGLRFDAQGVPRQRYPLVAHGVTRNLAHDRRTAASAGLSASTGNALAGGAAFGAIPLTPALSAGDTPVDTMIAGLERGLLVSRFHYCRVLDPKSQVVTGLTRNGTFLVEDGQIVAPVSDLRFTQSFVDALAPGSVSSVGDDRRYADGEFGPGMVITPSLHLASWRFTGGARG